MKEKLNKLMEDKDSFMNKYIQKTNKLYEIKKKKETRIPHVSIQYFIYKKMNALSILTFNEILEYAHNSVVRFWRYSY